MKTVDCRGLQHSQTLELARRGMAELPDKLEVLVDSAEIVEEIASLLAGRGYRAQSVLDGEQVYHIRASRLGFGMDDGGKGIPADLECRPRTLLILTGETIGSENDGLGRDIMDNFLATLSHRRDLWRVALVNSAVRLAATPGSALDALQAAAAKGVELLVHDASLAHFALAKALQAGRQASMTEIAASAGEADKVIRL